MKSLLFHFMLGVAVLKPCQIITSSPVAVFPFDSTLRRRGSGSSGDLGGMNP